MVNGFRHNVVLQVQQYTRSCFPSPACRPPCCCCLLLLLHTYLLLLVQYGVPCCLYSIAYTCCCLYIVVYLAAAACKVQYTPPMHPQSPRLPLPIYGSADGNIWKCSLPDYLSRDKMYALKMVKIGWQNMVGCYFVIVVVYQTTSRQQAPVVLIDYHVFSQTTVYCTRTGSLPVYSPKTKKGDSRLPLVLSFNGRGKLHRSVLPVFCNGGS